MVFYSTDTGRSVVRQELEKLGKDAAAAVGATLRRVAAGENFDREVKRLSRKLCETRTTLDGCEYRVLYAADDFRGESILLAVHTFRKTTAKTPRQAIKIAERRLDDWRARYQ